MKTDRNLKRNLLICLLAGSAVAYTLPLHAATSVIANSTLPTGGNFVVGGGNDNIVQSGLQMDITQTGANAVITWKDFSIGGSATVNFNGNVSGYNTLNYVNGGDMSQIYGTINANNNGNIYLVNPAGVQIGNSAQINVGSFHASTQTLNEEELGGFAGTITDKMITNPGSADAVLMSLGNINANNVTFEGNGRIVIDTERLLDASGDNKLAAANIIVNTNDKNNVVLGYDAYDETNGYTNVAGTGEAIATVNNQEFTKSDSYMWVEDVEQLQAINTNLSGSYALRNSIDGTEASAFKAIAGGTNDEYFTGKFDGLDYSIFNLNISGENNVGLFGKASGAAISNVSLVGGSISGTGNNVGAVVGNASGGTTITNAINSASVNGSQNVGGIVGFADKTTVNNAVNTGAVSGASDVGGLIGSMSGNSRLVGNSYNLGDVSGTGNNVGGLVGSANSSTIGDATNLVYNRLDVTGAYNVGGIVGSMQGSTVQYAENSGTVLATGNTTVNYNYHAGQQVGNNQNQHETVSKTAYNVQVANAGGIAGNSFGASTITNVTNTANVSSNTDTYQQDGSEHEYYTAGNVGGVVGKAVDTNITNATNKENAIRGAHNVGGVAGYFGGTGTVTGGINDGGDIMATGARDATGFVREQVNGRNTSEAFIVGNIGGIVGYMEGDGVYITASANRGTVHSQDIADQNSVLDTSKAANVGGIVGKIDRSGTKDKTEFSTVDSYTNAAVSNSYNTGDIMGYTGVGGIAGMMYNGEVVGSYNLGYMQSTRQASTNSGSIDSLNMGGIVGDSTANTGGKITLYDVYNKGQIGDEEFAYFGRHIGGIVGRLSGDVEKAYNTGDIYNGYNVVGGIAGWLYKGSIDNAFNTGNITVNNKNSATSQVGGLVGAAANYASISITNAYNLGTIRSFKANDGANSLGGIIGQIFSGYGSGNVNISNVYTTGNLYVDNGTIGSVYGTNEIGNALTVNNAYYITPENESGFTNLRDNANSQGATDVSYDQKSTYDYNFTGGITKPETNQGNVDENSAWRIYPGTTPILNAFLPNAENYFSNSENVSGISSIQYGTAYDPLLTIIKAADGTNDLTYSWSDLGISNAAGIAVYGAGLTLNEVDTSSGSGYFGGTIYTDGALNLNSNSSIGLGSGADIYGSAVNIEAAGNITVYGDVTATGNNANGATEAVDDTITVTNAGNITITGSNIDVYGTLTSAKEGASLTVPGINDSVSAWTQDSNAISNPNTAMTSVADRYAYTTGASTVNGDVTVEATNGNVGLYYGNKGEGITTTGGNLTVTGTGDVYVDSDLNIGGDLTLTAGADNEALLDITNIGQVQADNGTVENALTGLHNFLNHFANTGNNTITLSGTDDVKIAVDMWSGDNFNLNKFDLNGAALADKLDALNLSNDLSASDVTHIWVSNGEQLKNIQTYANENSTTDILSYNFALKNDINAADVANYQAIGGTAGYTGTFDGRGNRIIGLDATKATDANGNATTQTLTNAGIFSTVGEGGTVKNVNIYSSTFTGTATAAAVAGVNNGTIDNITTFGNTVTVTGDGGYAGGIVGVNNSGTVTENADGTYSITNGINDVESTGTVIAGGVNAIAGGLVGSNNGGLLDSYSNSAVTATTGTKAGLGGVVGVNTNTGTVALVDSLGVTNGGAHLSNNVGGVIGINNGTLNSAYNESIVSGKDNVGGIIGTNSSTVTNIVNATRVTGLDVQDEYMYQSAYVGGLVGTNSGSVSNGRNNGTITGTNYVGGMVGSNAAGAELTNLVNDSSAAIEGENYVGGIAGTNEGTITAEDQDNLINRGSITGQNYVGGVAGENIGTIEYVNNDVNLYVKDENKTAQYFGGVAGINGRVNDPSTDKDETATGTITSATNKGDVIAANAQYVGGIVGWNTVNGVLSGMGNSNTGRVEGATYVGGVAGKNDAAIKGSDAAMVTIENSGVVIAHNGGAGGIFGENTGNIEYAEISNSGIVAGTIYNGNETVTNGTGGIIGVNSGDIESTTLKNEVGGQVIGMENVGGLIGYNTGTIAGARDEADGYYKYQIYNNGVINAGKWVDQNEAGEEGYGVIDEGEFTAATAQNNSQNIGGLVGSNAAGGSLTAAYNTGVVDAANSTNVGGVVGNNAGTVDQVFNTVMIADGATDITGAELTAAIKGGTSVGGVVGYNDVGATLSNAYNTSEVSGSEKVGNLVGTNGGTISMVYATNTSGKLIGSNENGGTVASAYSFSADEATLSGVNVIAAADRQNASSYAGFDFDSTGNGNDGAKDNWKIYKGYSNPLLKVFLTKAQYTGNEQFTYNGQEQGLTIENNVVAEDSLVAYNNANSLLQAAQNTNAGENYLGIYSQQIAASGTEESFNPNNLGYDIDTMYEIDKAALTVTLDDVHRVYGSTAITQGDYQIGSITGWQSNDENNLTSGVTIDPTGNSSNFADSDTALTGNTTGKVTYNAGGTYTWNADVVLSEAVAENYEITTTTLTGNSYVEKADLTITLTDVERVYGNTALANDTAYGIASTTTLVNGDSGLLLNENAVKTDGALVTVGEEIRTNDVNAVDSPYSWSVSDSADNFTGVDNLGTNYNITVVNGNSKVTPKSITIKDLVASIVYGNQDSKGFVVNDTLSLEGVVYDDIVTIGGTAVYDVVSGSEYDTNRNSRVTADVRDTAYADSLSVSGITLGGADAGNYVLDTTQAVGDIKVTKAALTLTVSNAETTYGTAFDATKYGYTLGTLANGDAEATVKTEIGDVTYTNSAAKDGANGVWTDNAGTYDDAVGIDKTINLSNYEVTVNKGDATIKKADLNVEADDVTATVGNVPNTFTGTDINGVLVNGDVIGEDIYSYGISAGTDTNAAGEYKIGIYVNGTYYELSNPDWSKEIAFMGNYNVTFTPGTLTVSGTAVVPEPEVPTFELPENWPSNRWDYLFSDYPFDRNRNFRELKAEVNYVDGGMEI